MEQIHSAVIEDYYGVLCLLSEILRIRGHNIITITSSKCLCSGSTLHSSCSQQCHKCPCADFLLLDLYLIDFYTLSWWENAYNRGCPVPNVAKLSASWTETEKEKARQLNCAVFEKPFDVSEFNEWIAKGEKYLQTMKEDDSGEQNHPPA